MKLISLNLTNHHSYEIIHQFEESILQDNSININKKKISLLDKIHFFFKSKLQKIGFIYNFKTISKYKHSQINDSRHRFCIMMGPNGAKWNKFFPTWHAKSIYMFDAWPNMYPKIKLLLDTYKIDNLYVSSKKSAQDLTEIYRLQNVHWVPEGINIKYYNFLPYEGKDIDLISYGRNYQPYHDSIVDKFDLKYVYPVSGVLLFKSHVELTKALARSKISICFPSSLTHPERTSGTETMTNRYLEAIASRCLIIGKAPLEMIELFGYNPVIEVDFDNPAEQLKSIINQYYKYTSLIERNFKNLLENHLWENRWKLIKDLLFNSNKH